MTVERTVGILGNVLITTSSADDRTINGTLRIARTSALDSQSMVAVRVGEVAVRVGEVATSKWVAVSWADLWEALGMVVGLEDEDGS